MTENGNCGHGLVHEDGGSLPHSKSRGCNCCRRVDEFISRFKVLLEKIYPLKVMRFSSEETV